METTRRPLGGALGLGVHLYSASGVVSVSVSLCVRNWRVFLKNARPTSLLRALRRSEVGYEVTSIIMESEHRRAQQLASPLPLRVFGGTTLLVGLNRKPTGDVASRLFCWWPRFEDKTAPSAIEILARTQFDEAPLVNTGGYTNRHRSNGGLPAAMPIWLDHAIVEGSVGFMQFSVILIRIEVTNVVMGYIPQQYTPPGHTVGQTPAGMDERL